MTMSRLLYTESSSQLFDRWDPTTRYVSVFPLRTTTSSVELIIVRIVDAPGFDPHGVPVERSVTVGTPHLGTPANLENHGSALGARFRILFEERDSLYVAGVAHVFVVVLNLVTVWANVVFANLTLPPSRQEPSTLLYGTLPNKHSLLLFGLPGGTDSTTRRMKRRYVCPYPHNLLVGLIYALVNLSNLENPRNRVLSLWQ
jgi:hypothetical protein